MAVVEGVTTESRLLTAVLSLQATNEEVKKNLDSMDQIMAAISAELKSMREEQSEDPTSLAPEKITSEFADPSPVASEKVTSSPSPIVAEIDLLTGAIEEVDFELEDPVSLAPQKITSSPSPIGPVIGQRELRSVHLAKPQDGQIGSQTTAEEAVWTLRRVAELPQRSRSDPGGSELKEAKRLVHSGFDSYSRAEKYRFGVQPPPWPPPSTITRSVPTSNAVRRRHSWKKKRPNRGGGLELGNDRRLNFDMSSSTPQRRSSATRAEKLESQRKPPPWPPPLFPMGEDLGARCTRQPRGEQDSERLRETAYMVVTGTTDQRSEMESMEAGANNNAGTRTLRRSVAKKTVSSRVDDDSCLRRRLSRLTVEAASGEHRGCSHCRLQQLGQKNEA